MEKRILLVAFSMMILLMMHIAKEDPAEIRPEVEQIPEQVKMQEYIGTMQTSEVLTIVNHDDLELLSKIIDAESGSDWCSDTMQLYVGSVVLNRIKSDSFPDDMESVIYQKGQYSTASRLSEVTPSERARENAEYLLINGSVLDEKYVFQANFKQGKDIIKEQNMYFGKEK